MIYHVATWSDPGNKGQYACEVNGRDTARTFHELEHALDEAKRLTQGDGIRRFVLRVEVEVTAPRVVKVGYPQ